MDLLINWRKILPNFFLFDKFQRIASLFFLVLQVEKYKIVMIFFFPKNSVFGYKLFEKETFSTFLYPIGSLTRLLFFKKKNKNPCQI